MSSYNPCNTSSLLGILQNIVVADLQETRTTIEDAVSSQKAGPQAYPQIGNMPHPGSTSRNGRIIINGKRWHGLVREYDP